MKTWREFTGADAAAHNARVAGEPLPNEAGAGVARESKLHEQIADECKRRGFYVVHSRMDRATTTAVGCPDFVIAADGGRTYWVEAKGKKTKLTREQAGTLHWLRARGHVAVVVRSLAEFVEVIEKVDR